MAYKKLPGVLSFQRCFIVGDARFFSDVDGSLIPLRVFRHGIRGTQNVNTSGDDGSTAKSSDERNIVNVLTTESAKLAPESETLVTQFDMRTLDLDDALFACASYADNGAGSGEMRKSIANFVQRAKSQSGVEALACRYARNIANGRWLWRNRLVAENVEVRVTRPGNADDEEVASFDAFSIPLNDFSNYSEGERRLAKIIADGMIGNIGSKITVEARVCFGVRGCEVFPSQNYIDKENSKKEAKGFARSLYKLGHQEVGEYLNGIYLMGQAALRDQKITNAIRTIDTWYADYGRHRKPIPVEPNGANLDAMQFFRQGEASAFNLLKRIDVIDPSSDEGLFIMACMMRGGVYSESEKTNKKQATPKEAPKVKETPTEPISETA